MHALHGPPGDAVQQGFGQEEQHQVEGGGGAAVQDVAEVDQRAGVEQHQVGGLDDQAQVEDEAQYPRSGQDDQGVRLECGGQAAQGGLCALFISYLYIFFCRDVEGF